MFTGMGFSPNPIKLWNSLFWFFGVFFLLEILSVKKTSLSLVTCKVLFFNQKPYSCILLKERKKNRAHFYRIWFSVSWLCYNKCMSSRCIRSMFSVREKLLCEFSAWTSWFDQTYWIFSEPIWELASDLQFNEHMPCFRSNRSVSICVFASLVPSQSVTRQHLLCMNANMLMI